VTTGQYTPISEQAIRPSRRLQAIIERMMSLDPKERYRDMRALGQELLTLAGQRTRITWGLTFGEVAAAVRTQHSRDADDESTALARTRAPARPQRGSLWPLIGAGAVGVAAVAAVLNWPAKRNDADNQAIPATSAAAVTPVTTVAPATAARAAARTRAPDGPPSSSLPEPVAPAAAAAGTPAPTDVATVAPSPPSAAPRGDGPRPDPQSSPARAPVAPVERDGRTVQRPRPAPRAVAPEAAPAAPEWIIERAEPRTRSTSAPVQIGTNDAPIFD
jgi:hypothetical protein